MKVSIITDHYEMQIEAVFRFKKDAIEYLQKKGLRKFGIFWAKNKEDIKEGASYGIEIREVRNSQKRPHKQVNENITG